MLHDLIQTNYLTVIAVIFVLVFISTNHLMQERKHRYFYYAFFFIIILIVAENLERYAASLPYKNALRVWMSAVGYTVRPLIIYIVSLLYATVSRKRKLIFAVPLLVNAAVSFSALFTDAAFSFNEANEFVRGPLGYTAYLTSGFYLLVLFWETISNHGGKNGKENLIIVAAAVLEVISALMEKDARYRGVVNGTAVIALTFYYFYLVTQQFKRDSMTNAFNRGCFQMDAESQFQNISAVVALDLNNLKQINDRNGHDQGDKAIRTMADCVRKSLHRGCYIYRTGGDEFVLLCYKVRQEAVYAMIREIEQRMSRTPYSCAAGVAFREDDATFEELWKRADEDLYKDKYRMKKNVPGDHTDDGGEDGQEEAV
jgi:diguanylate cyclase (GGDEF)-like protein